MINYADDKICGECGRPLNGPIVFTSNERFNLIQSLSSPSVAAQTLYGGGVWIGSLRDTITVADARQLRDWLNKALPDETSPEREPFDVVANVIAAYQGDDDELARRIVDSLTAESLLVQPGRCQQCQQTGGLHLAVCDKFDPSSPETKALPCVWREGCKNRRICDEMGCCQRLGAEKVTAPVPDSLKLPVTSDQPCPTGDWVHQERNGKCIYCGAPMPSQSKAETGPCLCGRGKEFHPWRFCNEYKPAPKCAIDKTCMEYPRCRCGSSGNGKGEST